ncbi:MAG TPA: TIGR03557 family F420-dependent LLM class oxidoreductase [Actinomycetes bacterium]|nr:TIGR03557 family F420-dependent LLM class oxidoreductase [Actinomycetes bacterium]
MTEIGYFLSSEEHGPDALVRQAQQAEQAGFRSVWISDHYHPWNDRQGHSPFAWSVIGGIAATTRLRVTTAVTCPAVRIHPAVLAQAAATAALMLPGRFLFGVGSGENLNEHILGARWPRVEVRLQMLEEAVEVMRKLWKGKLTSHDGRFYQVENARIYSLPDEPPPVLMSALGQKSVSLAARVADGLISTQPDREALERYAAEGGKGPRQGGLKVCWGRDEQAARKTAFELWPNNLLPGQLAQELALPSHFDQATQLVTEDEVAELIPCGPDPERHLASIRQYLDAGFDEVYVSQIGDDQAGFFDFWRRELAPRLGARS